MGIVKAVPSAVESDPVDQKLMNKIGQQAEAINRKMEEKTLNTSDDFGLCNTCVNFLCAKTEFGIVKAKCQKHAMDMFLDTRHPIEKCSIYFKKGQLSLFQMAQMATLIDIPKDKAGFIRS